MYEHLTDAQRAEIRAIVREEIEAALTARDELAAKYAVAGLANAVERSKKWADADVRATAWPPRKTIDQTVRDANVEMLDWLGRVTGLGALGRLYAAGPPWVFELGEPKIEACGDDDQLVGDAPKSRAEVLRVGVLEKLSHTVEELLAEVEFWRQQGGLAANLGGVDLHETSPCAGESGDLSVGVPTVAGESSSSPAADRGRS